ncbi:hypothetical protein [Aerophototrophica crusticola]|uniref:hypothetical protein n=1 Tax=Aerophototrophica crusticola TaxID=1709002 RepID=UPI00384B5B01
MLVRTVASGVPEGTMADPLRAIAADFPGVDIGSYPAFRQGKISTSLVLRATDPAALDGATEAVLAMLRSLGVEPQVLEGYGDS